MNELREYTMERIEDLSAYEHNAKIHSDDQIRRLQESIREFGIVKPVLIDEDGMILAGHGIVEAAKAEGLEELPCIHAKDLSEAQKKAYILADNKLAELADWDMDEVERELAALEEMDFDTLITGFEFDNEPPGGGEPLEDDFDAAAAVDRIEEPKTKSGDIYQLGRHRMMCGDCTVKRDVEALTDGAEIECVVTDPPYCSGGYQECGKSAGSIGTTANKAKIANDTLSTRGYMALIKNMLDTAKAGMAYIFTDWRMWINLFDAVESSWFGVRNMIVWDKCSQGMGYGWRTQHEICMMASKIKMPFDKHKAQGNVIQCGRTGNINHPTEKPVELLTKIIDVTDFCSTFFDPFAGSGTTLVACEGLGRTCYAMELDPKYCDVIIERWEELTGETAKKVN